jgi:hypothetical protein
MSGRLDGQVALVTGGGPQIAAIPAEEYTPAQRVGDLLVRIAAGDADPLNGRFLHAEEDLDELLADAARNRRRRPAHPAPAGVAGALRRAVPGVARAG